MLLAKAKDPAFWAKVRTDEAYRPFVDELLEMWQRECGVAVPAMKYSDYIMFDKTGSRDEYENAYFLRRRQMNTAALMSMIYPEENKYSDYLIDVIWAILDEYSWVVPAHIPTFTENVVEFIDLFASETGFALAEIDYILADRLPPLIRSRIDAEIDRRIIKAYLNHTYWWDTGTNNWSAVCLNSVIGAIMYRRPELVEQLMPRIDRTIECYMSGFPEDGICVEGFGYWHYGFGFYLCLADMLYDFTDGKVNRFDNEKVRRIATFAQKMFLDNDVTVSFSDGGTKGRYHIGMLHYLSHKYPGDITVLPREYSYTNDRCGRWCLHLRAILWFDGQLETVAHMPCRTDYMEGAGWFIKVTEDYAFAAKGGHNAESHNHNDLGAFILARGGRQILTDPGAGKYTKQYFRGSTRYSDFMASSRSHCVPIIDGKYQEVGEQHRAITEYRDGKFFVDFAGGYDIPELVSLRRSFDFHGSSVLLRDSYRFDGAQRSVAERFISTVKPAVSDGVVTLDELTLTHGGGVADIRVTEEEYGGRTYYCIDYLLTDGSLEFELNMNIK